MWRLPAFSWPSATVPWSPCASSHALVCGEAQAVDEHKAHDSSCSSFQYITVKILHNSINAYIEGGKKGRKTILKSYSEHLTTTTIVNIIIFISNNNNKQQIYIYIYIYTNKRALKCYLQNIKKQNEFYFKWMKMNFISFYSLFLILFFNLYSFYVKHFELPLCMKCAK